jgi:hypothetical protein
VFSCLDFSYVPDLNFLPGNQARSSSSANLNGAPFTVGRQCQEPLNSNSLVPSTGANAIPNNPQPKGSVPKGSRLSCSRCFSNYHSRPICRPLVRCSVCFRLGHIAKTCKFPPQFPELSIDFYSNVHFNKILGDHGQLIAWEEDYNHLARLLVKVCVVRNPMVCCRHWGGGF